MQKIDLKLDESNELMFRLTIEGTEERASSIRFICEGNEDVSYMFKGSSNPDTGEISITIPPMTGRLPSGIYEGRLEVIVEGRYLEPMKVLADFKSTPKVVAENVRIASTGKPEVKVSASVVTAKAKPEPVVEKKEALAKPKTLAEKFGYKK